jgi:hypothetical protein
MANKMFLIARHTQTVRNPKNPKQGMMTNESFHVADKVKNKDLSEASIILDVANQKVIKNRFPDRSFDDLFLYFMSHYKDHIQKWLDGR